MILGESPKRRSLHYRIRSDADKVSYLSLVKLSSGKDWGWNSFWRTFNFMRISKGWRWKVPGSGCDNLSSFMKEPTKQDTGLKFTPMCKICSSPWALGMHWYPCVIYVCKSFTKMDASSKCPVVQCGCYRDHPPSGDECVICPMMHQEGKKSSGCQGMQMLCIFCLNQFKCWLVILWYEVNSTIYVWPELSSPTRA